jgi:hypothetical protein
LGVLGSNLRKTPAIPSEVFGGFSYTLQANARVVPQLSHVCILPTPFPFITHELAFHLILYSLDTGSVVNKPQRALASIEVKLEFLGYWTSSIVCYSKKTREHISEAGSLSVLR